MYYGIGVGGIGFPSSYVLIMDSTWFLFDEPFNNNILKDINSLKFSIVHSTGT